MCIDKYMNKSLTELCVNCIVLNVESGAAEREFHKKTCQNTGTYIYSYISAPSAKLEKMYV